MLTPDGSHVVTDSQRRAGITVDFVCMRYRTGVGNAFRLTMISAGNLAAGMHERE